MIAEALLICVAHLSPVPAELALPAVPAAETEAAPGRKNRRNWWKKKRKKKTKPGGAPAPEPGTLALLGLGLAGAGSAMRRRRKKIADV